MTPCVAVAELRQGMRVRILGRYYKRRVTVFLNREPVDLGHGLWCVTGFSARSGKRGNSSAFIVRIVDGDELAEVVES